MRLELFDYLLPPERIAQVPADPRDSSRLLHLPARGPIGHLRFTDLPSLLAPGDLLVVNDSRVLPARLVGRKETGARVELLLLQRRSAGLWEALVHPARRLRPGARVLFREDLTAEVVGALPEGTRLVRLDAPGGPEAAEELAHAQGSAPLPPYIHTPLADPERYQTIYARDEGSAAAPTAGLHFTPRVFDALRERGVGTAAVTLHVGLATFRPVQVPEIEEHRMHEEWYSIPEETARLVEECPGRIVAAGTTTLRALESAAEGPRRVRPGSGVTRLYVTPGYSFRTADLLLTNFHTPRSSLLILVSAFSGLERIRSAYREALDRDYRFLSFGDAMLLERADDIRR